MARAVGGLRALGSLVLLGLYSWTGVRAAAPNGVRNLGVETQTNTSITLRWDVPEGSDPMNLTYWVQWFRDGDRNETQHTTNTSITVDGLNPGSSYEFSVWAEREGANSSKETLNAATAPNPVKHLRVETQTNTSITLRWDVPEGSDPMNLTYWVQWFRDGDRSETQHTTNTSITVDALSPGSSYEFSVWAEREAANSSKETLNAATAPNPVRHLRVETQTDTSITLRWDVPEGSDPMNLTYWVQWFRDGDRNETQHTTNTSITVDGLSPGSSYEFSVWAEREGTNSYRETLNAATAPNPVRHLRVETQTNTSITLRWDVPEGSDPMNLTYWVQWFRDGDRSETQHTTNTSITVDGLSPGSSYEFSVWAEREAANSSKEILNAATAPNPVRHLRVETQTNTSITLRWDVPEGSDPMNLTYWVQWFRDGDRSETQHTTNTSITVDGLSPGSSYEFSVWAEREAANSSKEILNAATAPNPVRHLRVETQTNTSITLRWDVPEGSDPMNLTYWVQWFRDGDRNESQHTTNTSITANGLNPGSSYEFSVWAEREGANSSKENLIAATAPNPVRHLRVETQTNTSITLCWDVPEGSDPMNLTYWVQWFRDGDRNETQHTTNTSITVDGLNPGSSYEFSVWAEREGANSSKETLNAATAPNPVKHLRVETQTNTSITLRWDVPEGSDPMNLTYWVQWFRDGDRSETQHTTNTSITVDGLSPGSSYEFSVWAEREAANSSKETLNAATAPNPVRHLRVETQTNTSITLRWDVPEGSDPMNLTYWVQWFRDGDRNESQHTTNTSITANGLNPGSSYEFSVWAEREGANSSKENLNAATAPNPVRHLRVETQTNTSITLCWDVPEGSDPMNLTYWVQWFRDGDRNETQHTTNTSITVDGLNPGSSYEFSVWAEREGANSSKETLNAATAPNPVKHLRVETQTNTSITLRWDVPEGSDPMNLTYWVQWFRDGDRSETQHTTNTSITVDGLSPGSSYEFSVWAEREAANSSKETLNAATAPNPVRHLRVETQTNTSITLRWDVPEGSDPMNLTYWVQWFRDGDRNESQHTTNTSITANGLNPGSSYEFSVWAEREGANSSKENLNAATAPNPVRHLRVETQTDTSITLRWDVPEGSDPMNLTYWVQWFRDGDRSETQHTTNTSITVDGLNPGSSYEFSVWAEREGVNSYKETLKAATAPASANITSCVSTSWGYAVNLTWSCPSGSYDTFELEVGEQRSSQNKSLCMKDVVVSGLRPAQAYTATITTVWDELKAPPTFVTCYTDSTVVIAGVVGVLLLLILVSLLIVFLRKRNKKNHQKEEPKDLMLSFSGDILAKDFADHVRQNEKDSNYGFAEEYQQLALVGHDQYQTVASTPENMAKNRYRNVLPYDWSRVPLNSFHKESSSDYINASFMPGLQSNKEFIAAQGPLPQTVGDFWHLVWEQQSHTLIMLTNCMESGRVKCEHYWPLDAQPCTYGHLRVTLVGEEVTENWTVRNLQLLHMEKQKSLAVRQFHYLAWPDHGVPHSPDPLLAFWKTLRLWLDQNTGGGPPIVHCSAGVGRTGTLIALDVLLRQLECEGLVGPFSFVKKMRESRPLMVQTEAQYVFLHQCILRYLQQSASDPVQKEAMYEDVSNLVYENIAAIRAQELEV